jgi:transcriptional regulator with XRE-family HTH domain
MVRLREWRQRRGESLYTLADKAGVHWTTVVRIEQERLSPTVATLEKLARALRIDLRDFFPPRRHRGVTKTGGQHGKQG